MNIATMSEALMTAPKIKTGTRVPIIWKKFFYYSKGKAVSVYLFQRLPHRYVPTSNYQVSRGMVLNRKVIVLAYSIQTSLIKKFSKPPGVVS